MTTAKPTTKTATKEKSGKKTYKMRVRLKIRAFDYKVLDKSVKKIVEALEGAGAFISGPLPLPTKIKKWAFRRSQFKFSFSGERLEQREHCRLIDIFDPTPKMIDTMQNLAIASGIDVDIKVGV